MSKENLKDELKPFYEKGDCCSWIVELRKGKYQLQQENKQLKESLDFLWNKFKKVNTINRKVKEYIKKLYIAEYDGNSYYIKDKNNNELGIEDIGKNILEILGDKE